MAPRHTFILFILLALATPSLSWGDQPTTPQVWLGIVVENVDAQMAQTMDLDQAQGVFIALTVPFGPADRQGLLIADIIQGINGQHVQDISHLKTILSSKTPGDKMTLHIIRDNSPHDITLTLPEINEQAIEGIKPTSGQDVL